MNTDMQVEIATIRQLCTFRVGAYTYGVDVLDVREINSSTQVTPVSHAPAGVRGLVNVRGKIYLICDLARVLAQGETEPGETSNLILFKESVGPSFGIIVDAVGDILDVGAGEIAMGREAIEGAPVLEAGNNKADFLLRGVCKRDDRLVVLVDAHRLLTAVKA